MLLKKQYDHNAPQDKWIDQYRDKEGRVVEKPTNLDQFLMGGGSTRKVPPVCGVKILHAGEKQHFSPKFVEGGMKEGWLVMGKGSLVLESKDQSEFATYKILRTPGYYCCFCKNEIPDAGTIVNGQTKGTRHVREFHADEGSSPDSQNPSGYAKLTYYDCVRVAGNAPVLKHEEWMARFKRMIGRG